MDISTLQKRLRGVRDSWPEIAKRTGVSIHTIRKIAYGDRKNPSMKIVGPLLSDAEVMGEREAA
ncbi:MAG: hypothetical protein RLZZ460_667 [Chloroflexota bacterium]